MGRRSAWQVLESIPPVTDVGDFALRLAMPKTMARIYLKRWSDAGLLSRFASGVYFNLVADKSGPQTRIKEALDRLLNRPSVLVGGAALQHHGWTDQIHRRLDIAVPVVRGMASLPDVGPGIRLQPRPLHVMQALLSSASGPGPGGLLVASPEFAIADSLAARLRLKQSESEALVKIDEIDADAASGVSIDLFAQALILMKVPRQERSDALDEWIRVFSVCGDACNPGY